MSIFYEAMILSLIAGVAIPIGGIVSSFENIRPLWLERELRHSVIAFGGGVLISAVALVLIPEGIKGLSVIAVMLSFMSGGFLFMILDKLISTRIGPASQLIAMLVDFMPEAIALGATLAIHRETAILLAILIALQNLPEGFNSYREIVSGGNFNRIYVIVLFFALSLLGPVCAYIGLTVLSGNDNILGIIMVTSAAGILYLTFQDIAPQAKLNDKWAPSLGAVAGFMLGLAGHMILIR